MCVGPHTIHHELPLMYNMTDDRNEQHLLTPLNYARYFEEVELINRALKRHYAGVIKVKNQMRTEVNKSLQVCCHTPPDCNCSNVIPKCSWPICRSSFRIPPKPEEPDLKTDL